jgi:hypothetical protein
VTATSWVGAAGVNVVAWSAGRGALLAAAAPYRQRFPALVRLLGSPAVARLERRADCRVELHAWAGTARGHDCETITLWPEDFAGGEAVCGGAGR